MWWRNHDRRSNHVDTVHECDGRTDRQTDRQTDRITITKTVHRRASHGNYSSRIIVFSYIPIEFGQTGISAIRSVDYRKPHRRTKHEVDRTTPRGNMAIWNFPKCEVVGRSSVVGRWSPVASRSVLNIYFFLHWSHILLFATLGT